MDKIVIEAKFPRHAFEWISSITFKDIEGMRDGDKGWKHEDKVSLMNDIHSIISKPHYIVGDNVFMCETYTTSKNGFPGRLYSNGCQSVWRPIRSNLLANTTDVDMSMAMPRILLWVCKQLDIDTPELAHFITNRDGRDGILCRVAQEEGISLKKAKEISNIPWTYNRYMDTKSPALKKIDQEAKQVQEKLMSCPGLKWILPYCKNHNTEGSFISHLYQYVECQLLLHVYHMFTNKLNIPVVALVFDGLNLDGKRHYENDSILTHAQNACEEVCPGINMIWSFKEIDFTVTKVSSLKTIYTANGQAKELRAPVAISNDAIIPPNEDIDQTPAISKSPAQIELGLVEKVETRHYEHGLYLIRECDVMILQLTRDFLRLAATILDRPYLERGHPNSFGGLLDPEDPINTHDSIFSDSPSSQCAKVTIMCKTHRIIQPFAADTLSLEERILCIPIQNSLRVALKQVNSDTPKIQLTLLKGRSNVSSPDDPTLFIHKSDSGARITIGSKERRAFYEMDVPLVHDHEHTLLSKLLYIKIPDRGIQNKLCKIKALPADKFEHNGYYKQLPDLLAQQFASILQDHLRIHVLVTASLEKGFSRPLSLEGMTAYTYRPRSDQSTWRTILSCNMHPSSSTCLCNAHRCVNLNETQSKRVQARIILCGQPHTFNDGYCRCPVHTNFRHKDPIFGTYCVANLAIEIRCQHTERMRGVNIHLSLNDLLQYYDCAPAVMAIATLGSHLAQKSDTEYPRYPEEIKNEIDKINPVLHECQQHRLDHRSSCASVERDALVADALRTLKFGRKGVGKIVAIDTNVQSDAKILAPLAKAYSHLFRPIP